MTQVELCLDPMMSRSEAQLHLARMFAAAGLDTPEIDGRLILCAALSLDHVALIREPDAPIGPAAAAIAALARRRSNYEPV